MGVTIASAIALKTIDDLYSGDLDEESEDDRDTYRGVAAWLLAISALVIITQVIMVIIRALYVAEVVTVHFAVFGILVSFNANI